LLDFHFPMNLWFAIAFMTVYGIVIALFKDLPDVEGDSKENLRTLSVRLGVCIVVGLFSSSFCSEFLLAFHAAVFCVQAVPFPPLRGVRQRSDDECLVFYNDWVVCSGEYTAPFSHHVSTPRFLPERYARAGIHSFGRHRVVACGFEAG
jgi:hypothetical protein